ncbi:GNAT family N-acetyltransferase, partial [Yoonia sp.]|uniref:GNAT family N-acetyltransferase n=1 Tax=Yoonia sp. TaxID=2212373 RepID=UPI0019FFC764
GALAVKDGYGEIKSMFVSETARGQGIADALLRQIEDQARADGLPLLRLETGDALHAAQRLYARHGFTPCGPFGDYPAAKTSVFMEKPL